MPQDSSESINIATLPAETREALFRLQQRHSLLKWLVGTVGLTAITTVVSWYFQHREVTLQEVLLQHERKMAELAFEQKYLGEFLEFALVEDIDSRLRFAHYFASVSTNPELAGKWNAYHADLLDSVPKDENNTDSVRIGGVEALTGRKITRIFIGAEAAATMADFRAFHVDKLGWADIAFHYYVDVDGSVKLARPIGKTPAFVLNHNEGSIAIGVACSGWSAPHEESPEGHSCEFSTEQKDALLTLTSKLMVDHGLSPDVIGKRSDFRPVPDLLGTMVSDLQDLLLGPRPRKL